MHTLADNNNPIIIDSQLQTLSIIALIHLRLGLIHVYRVLFAELFIYH